MDGLESARKEFAELCRAIADPDPQTGQSRGERLKILAFRPEAEVAATELLEGLNAEIIPARFGDIWLRDTAPIFGFDSMGRVAARCFQFNGWGGKYVLKHDDEVCTQVVAHSGVEAVTFDWILEGGSIEADGQGTILTTRQCLLNRNRNAGVSEQEMERRLRESLGAEKVLWLDEGLAFDHTDGHIDNLARFVRPGVVACPKASGSDDPNAKLYARTLRALESMRDATGQKLEVVQIPSPGLLLNEDDEVTPASHMNFYISNTRVIVPVYGAPSTDDALSALQEYFPEREVIGLRADHILTGGGSFHCITQNEPAPLRLVETPED